MYFPVGWPKVLNIPNVNNCSIRQLVCNRDKILFVVLTENAILIYYCKPCLLIVIHQRDEENVKEIGLNDLVEWKPDSSALVVTTSQGYMLFYKIKVDSTIKGLYDLVDPPQANLRRDSAELFVKEVIPPLQVELEKQIYVGACINSLTCIRDELMVSVSTGHIYRYRWNGTLNLDYSADLRRVPFCVDQHVSKAIPIFEENTYITQIEYSPLNGGFAVVFNDGRAAFLTASCLRFDPNQMQGIWATGIDDATCASVNHKFRLITFGRQNSQGVVYNVDETTGGLVLSHKLTIPGQVFPGPIGAVHCMRWSPDSCVLAMSWQSGGISLWSTFGALLMCTLSWDYGLNVDLSLNNPLNVYCLDWSAEGYQLWMVKGSESMHGNPCGDSVVHLNFVKSALTVNPCMSHQNHLYLQGEDKLYVSLSAGFTKVFSPTRRNELVDISSPLKSKLGDNKQWSVVQIPSAYSATNWPIRYSAIDSEGSKLAVAGKAGLAHYSFLNHKWKLFGNETQEKDMLVTGGLLWWRKYIVAGCYNIPQNQDELRFYPSSTRLSNVHMTMVKLSSQSLLLDELHDHVLVFCADNRITIYNVYENNSQQTGRNVNLSQTQIIDLSGLGVHPACFVAITLFSLRTEASRTEGSRKDNFIINVSGRVLMVNLNEENNSHILEAPVGLASCVENVWSPCKFSEAKPHLTEALWLFCGAHGMRVWLPLFPRGGESTHTYMSKRIMLPFHLKVYPLAILFEDAILLGVENDTMLYSSDASSPFSLPFCVLERTSQVYLHQVLRQLIKRNLGFHAWEIARCCTSLPYFPHSLELLLHEVLEEEATSKEPIPDALLPSIIEFIQEFPVYLDTVVQCARKTEIALWPYLFSVAGKPKDLFQKCLASGQLETAASYLIILQNLEPSTISRQYATMLLDSTLHSRNWELSKELVRFLKAIDPNDVEHTRASLSGHSKYGIPQTPTVNNNEEDLSLVLGTSQVCRGRSFSTTVTPKIQNQEKSGFIHRTSMTDMTRKKSVPSNPESKHKIGGSAEEFFMDKMVERHARRLLSQHGLRDLGKMAAIMDFPLVSWLAKERNRAAVLDNCVTALKNLHESFSWPYPSTGSVAGVEEDKEINCSDQFGSQVGDSGYMSYQSPYLKLYSDTVQQNKAIDEQSIISEAESWQYQEESGEWCAGLPWTELPSPQLLEQIQVGSKGSPKAEIQLRYLLQLLTDAGCLQWALIVSVLLGDAMAVLRVSNAARSPDQTFESVVRLRDDMATLAQWGSVECPSYRHFTAALQPQISVLNKLLTAKHKTSLPNIPAILPTNQSNQTEVKPVDKVKEVSSSIIDTDPVSAAQSRDHSNSCVVS